MRIRSYGSRFPLSLLTAASTSLWKREFFSWIDMFALTWFGVNPKTSLPHKHLCLIFFRSNPDHPAYS